MGPRERRYDRTTQLALVAAHDALADAGLLQDGGRLTAAVRTRGRDPRDVARCAAALESAFARFGQGRGVGPHVSPLTTTGGLSGSVARELGLRGPNLTVSAACSSATQAIGVALDVIRNGRADVMLAGGAEACLTPFCVAMLDAAGILSHRIDEPRRASRPFDRDRDGIVLGEGAGIVVLESEAHARARGVSGRAALSGLRRDV